MTCRTRGIADGADPAAATDAYPWGLYLHVIVVSLIGGFGVLAWFVLYEWLNKLIWDGGLRRPTTPGCSPSSASRSPCSSGCW